MTVSHTRRYRGEVQTRRRAESAVACAAKRVFSLLVEARQRIAANIAAIEAQRDFWLAKTNLLSAVVGGGGSGEAAAEGLRAGMSVAETSAH